MGRACSKYEGQERCIYGFGGEIWEKEDTGVYGRIILKWIFKRLDRGHRLDRSNSVQGQVAGSCECGNEPSGSIKYAEFLD